MNRDDRVTSLPWKTALCLLLLVAAILAGCGGGSLDRFKALSADDRQKVIAMAVSR